MSNLGKWIKEAREAKNIKQVDLNKHVGAGGSYCSQLENGVHEGGKHLPKVCEFLGLDLAETEALKKSKKGVKKAKTYQLKDKDLPLKAKGEPRRKVASVRDFMNKIATRTTTLPLSATPKSFESELTAEIMDIVRQRVEARVAAIWS